jgi:hypothetical protein
MSNTMWHHHGIRRNPRFIRIADQLEIILASPIRNSRHTLPSGLKRQPHVSKKAQNATSSVQIHFGCSFARPGGWCWTTRMCTDFRGAPHYVIWWCRVVLDVPACRAHVLAGGSALWQQNHVVRLLVCAWGSSVLLHWLLPPQSS